MKNKDITIDTSLARQLACEALKDTSYKGDKYYEKEDNLTERFSKIIDNFEERLFTKEEEIVVAKALANAIDIILNNGEDPNVLAELLELDTNEDLREKFIGIYDEESSASQEEIVIDNVGLDMDSLKTHGDFITGKGTIYSTCEEECEDDFKFIFDIKTSRIESDIDKEIFGEELDTIYSMLIDNLKTNYLK